MSRTIIIDPVTRIEGHAKISLQLNDEGRVDQARFHVTELRGFERFCEGRSFWEMPGITARICGICPVSHILASSKAGDQILGVDIPETAHVLRRLMNWAQLVQSHALSFFLLSGPDLFMGMDTDPATRNMAGLLASDPGFARDGIRLRRFGQEMIRLLSEKSIHGAWSVPGGVRTPLSEQGRQTLLAQLPEAFEILERALDRHKNLLERMGDEVLNYGDFPSLFMGLVGTDGSLEHYDGVLRVMDSQGRLLEDALPTDRYADVVQETAENWSYLKFPHYAAASSPREGMYRVGPLARLNLCDFAGTPKADRELRQFRRLGEHGRPVTASFHYHYARLIEILFSLEKIEETLAAPVVTGTHVRSNAGVNRKRGIGVTEAPRGTLFHDYEVDDNGVLQRLNLVIATGQNNLAMNETILQIAKEYVRGNQLQEGMLNRVEHGIRTFDPCLSCSTHAAGQMPIRIELFDGQGRLLDAKMRS